MIVMNKVFFCLFFFIVLLLLLVLFSYFYILWFVLRVAPCISFGYLACPYSLVLNLHLPLKVICAHGL